MKKIIVSVLGHDRPGILAAVSGALLDNGCNIENASQTILQSVFGSLLLVSTPEDLDTGQLESRMSESLCGMGLDIFIKELPAAKTDGHSSPGEAFIITACGPDRPGLVSAISRCMANHGINITNLRAVFKGGDVPDDNVMIFDVDIPEAVDLAVLNHDLDEITERLQLTINLQHRGIFNAMNRI
ncbi:MAG: ACT domain-containing protein [Gammaproteobacteria bacterium]|jgi:glycine cleavage system transcriptional repressor|nr:MAG: ACT domain-containing protein [Gammaproteobacteria bacterium]